MALPRLAPMKAAAGSLPEGPDWAFEIKWDGMRAVAELGDGPPRLLTTTGNDAGPRFPELVHLADAVAGRPAVLDGEIVAFDATGRPSFSALQRRIAPHRSRVAANEPPPQRTIAYVAFDLLHFDGHDAWTLPWQERRTLLEQLVEPTGCCFVSPVEYGGGTHLFMTAQEQGLEGVMAKRVDASYEPGRRSTNWRKVKVRHRQEFVVGGWTGGTGARRSTFGALALGYFEGERLIWVGNVGSGFRDAELVRWSDQLATIATTTCPFDAIPPSGPTELHWVEPVHVVEVVFAEWTLDRHLRHAVYVAERHDRDARSVGPNP